MKISKIILGVIACISLASCSNDSPKSEKAPVYEESWESLSKNNKEPEWFADAKLGIYFHWGPYCVPAYGNEWYPRWMYMKDPEGWGKGIYEYRNNFV